MLTLVEKYVYTFSDLRDIVVLGSAHNLRNADLLIQLYDGAGHSVGYGGHRVHPDTFDVFITVAQPMSGRVVLLG